ncbi:MAG: hypothetical protein AMJ84_00055 [Acidithiobacillales bacterium SM23_46]|nr:MAG: hypothetical protein AMJ84_00055 [Acidithiobacillales bacterium SM23_46]
MRLSLEIEGNGSAFADGGETETARLLRQAANRIEAGHDCGNLLDINGNTCGAWSFEATAPESAICPDCGTWAEPDAIGQTCNECGRGIIEADDF